MLVFKTVRSYKITHGKCTKIIVEQEELQFNLARLQHKEIKKRSYLDSSDVCVNGQHHVTPSKLRVRSDLDKFHPLITRSHTMGIT